MKWKLKLAAWLLRGYAKEARLDIAEVLIFADLDVLDFEALRNSVSAQDQIPVSFFPVKLRQSDDVRKKIIGMTIPKVMA